MPETGDELVYRMHGEAAARLPNGPLTDRKRPTIPYTELPEANSDDVFYLEWNLYRREIGRWFAEGHEGKWVLIKGETVIGFYATREEARTEGRKRYWMNPFLVQQIRAEEPLYRVRG